MIKDRSILNFNFNCFKQDFNTIPSKKPDLHITITYTKGDLKNLLKIGYEDKATNTNTKKDKPKKHNINP